jgi:hypothetical protein
MSPTIGERVVAEVRHEFGNYFHKLYYWADFLAESRSGRAGDVTATQMLEETIRGVEELLQVTLEYVRPMAASPIHMPLREVVDGIARQLATGLAGRTIAVAVDPGASSERAVLLDPGRLSQLLGALARRIDAMTVPSHGLAVRLALDRHETGDVLNVEVAGGATGTAHTTLGEVEWAIAENVARLVGGALTMHETGGRVTFALTLSLRS